MFRGHESLHSFQMRNSLSFVLLLTVHHVFARHNQLSWSDWKRSASIYKKPSRGSSLTPPDDNLQGNSPYRHQTATAEKPEAFKFDTLRGVQGNGITWKAKATESCYGATGSSLIATNSMMPLLTHSSESPTPTQQISTPPVITPTLLQPASRFQISKDAILNNILIDFIPATVVSCPTSRTTVTLMAIVSSTVATTLTTTLTSSIPSSCGILPHPWNSNGGVLKEGGTSCDSADPKLCPERPALKLPSVKPIIEYCKKHPKGGGGLRCYKDTKRPEMSLAIGLIWQKQDGCDKEEKDMGASFNKNGCEKVF